MAVFDSLVLADQIELLGGPGGVPSDYPLCAGVTFRLQPGYGLGEAQPTQDFVAPMLLDGERPVGRRSSNRTITLPIAVDSTTAPGGGSFSLVSQAVEFLTHLGDADSFPLTWTRAQAGDPKPLPLVFDCYRAGPASVAWGGIDGVLHNPIAMVTLTITASPYGHADVPTIVDFPTAILGRTPPPPSVVVDTYNTVPGNWLQGAASTFEGSTGGWTAQAGCTIAPSTTQAHGGAFSLAVTATGAPNAIINGPAGLAGLPVKKGQMVTVSFFVRASTTVRSVQNGVTFYDVNGNQTAQDFFFGNNDTNTGFTQNIFQDGFTAPADGFATPAIQINSPANGEIHFIDDVLIAPDWHSSAIGPTNGSAHWDPSLYGNPTGFGAPAYYVSRGLPPVSLMAGWQVTNTAAQLTSSQAGLSIADGQKLTVGDQFQVVRNWLSLAGSGSVHNTDFEGTIGTWQGRANMNVSLSSAQAHTGTNSMLMASIAAGNMSGRHTNAANFATNGLAVIPGQQVLASAWYRAAASPRSCGINVDFFDAAGNLLSNVAGPTITDTTTGWTQATDGGVIFAPAAAAWAIAVPDVLNTTLAAEQHFVDDVVMGVQAGQPITVTFIGAPFFGGIGINFSPAADHTLLTGEILIQTGPLPNLGALTFYTGLGSTNYFQSWCRRGGPVRFSVALYDALGGTCSFSRTQQMRGTNNSAVPRWQLVRVPIPAQNGFNFDMVTGYAVTITNRATVPGQALGAHLAYTDCYLDTLTAVPTASAIAQPQRGTVLDLAGLPGTARSPANWTFQNQGTQVLVTKTFNQPGGFNWTAPPGVTTAAVYVAGSGGNGGTATITFTSGGGGAGGGTAQSAAIALTPGVTYNGFVGAPGGGTNSSFTGDAVTLTGHNGTSGVVNAPGTGGAAGTGGFTGGGGGSGNGGTTSGGGGGSSAGTGANGNTGAAGGSGGAGGAAVTGGGAGAHGRPSGTPGANGKSPGGGGAGGVFQSNKQAGGTGGNGLVTITYLAPPGFSDLIVHRPGFDAPAELCPFVSIPVDDTPNGSIQYPVQALYLGMNARFNGTYTIWLVASAFDTPANPRTLTVTVTAFEQGGGYSYSVSTVPLTVTPNNLASQMVNLGELNLPWRIVPPDALDTFYTVAVTSTDTSDAFFEVLFLDTQGSTVVVQSNQNYVSYFLDAPTPELGYGIVAGSSVVERSAAVSVMDVVSISGVPLDVDPYGNQQLLVYSPQGVPAAQCQYLAAFWLERAQ